MENWLAQVGTGTKHLTERYAEYPAPAHDQQLYYTYEPSSASHGHVASSKHHYGGGGHKHNGAMSALTLLAFLFFLHILQQCLKEHMTSMSTPQVMVVSAGREGEQVMAKTSNKDKLDKAGLGRDKTSGDQGGAPAPPADTDEIFLTRVATAEHTPQAMYGHKNKIVSVADRSFVLDGFVSAMDEK